MTGIRETLKAATAVLHDDIEAAMTVMRPDFTADDHRALITRLYGFYQPCEAAVRNALKQQGLDFYETRLKTPLLLKDLAFFNIDPAHIALNYALPPMEILPAVFGALYVIEGATLGGQLIAQKLKKDLGLEPAGGCAFHASYGKESAARWREFCVLLEQYAAADPALATSAAVETFSAMNAWLCEKRAAA